MADIFDVLADSTRRQLLETLHERRLRVGVSDELSVGELVDQLALSQPTVSKHLQRLRELGLVSARKVGQHHYYSLQTAPLREIDSWVRDLLSVDEHAPTADSDSAAAFSAWAGADIGGNLGRKLAGGTHQARTVVTDASSKVAKKIPRLGKRKADGSDIDTE